MCQVSFEKSDWIYNVDLLKIHNIFMSSGNMFEFRLGITTTNASTFMERMKLEIISQHSSKNINGSRILNVCGKISQVSEIHPGSDGCVRIVTVTTSIGQFKKLSQNVGHYLLNIALLDFYFLY